MAVRRISATARYALFGVAFGVAFPVLALPVACYVATGGCSVAGLLHVQSTQPLLWIIESAPLWLGIFAAIGGRRQDRLESVLSQMEEIIEARTSDMRRAVEDAQEANETKTRFLANMSHEIRTPMTAILGYAEELMDPELGAEERDEAARIIYGNGEHLLTILNDILDLSKIELGRMEFERVPCSPRQIVQEVAMLMRERAASKGIDFEARCDGPVPREILTDPTRLRQVLINIIGNAVKFTDEGTVRVTGRLADLETEPTLEIEIADTGVGMSDEESKRIFSAFLQGDQSTTRRFGGTGLGLSITQRLVELMGGWIGVESELGKGSVFVVHIPTGPLDASQVEENGCSDGRVRGSDELARRLAFPVDPELIGRRVLVAEDNPVNRALVEKMLGRCEVEVTCAVDGREALRCVESAERQGRQFDLVLMDVQMPVMDGLTATRELRRRGFDRPILAFTASAMVADRERCFDAGCDDFVSKPIRRQQLVDQLHRLLVEPPVQVG